MNKTQKNWRRYWKNYKPTENDLKYRSTRHIKPTYIIVPSCIGLILSAALFFGRHTIYQIITLSNNYKLQTAYKESNKVGFTMHKNIDKILTTFNDITDNDKEINEIYIFEDEIRNMNLSDEYISFEQACIIKLDKYIDFLTLKEIYMNNPSESNYKKVELALEKYNKIDVINELAKSFDQSNVEYEIKNGKIFYTYQKV